MRSGFLMLVLTLSTVASAGVIEDVRDALDHNNFSAAEATLRSYHSQHGADRRTRMRARLKLSSPSS